MKQYELLLTVIQNGQSFPRALLTPQASLPPLTLAPPPPHTPHQVSLTPNKDLQLSSSFLTTQVNNNSSPKPARFQSQTCQIPVPNPPDSSPKPSRFQSQTRQIPVPNPPDSSPKPARFQSQTCQIPVPNPPDSSPKPARFQSQT